MCEYCNKKKIFEGESNKRIINKSLDNNICVILEIDINKLTLWIDNLSYYDTKINKSDCLTAKKINFCPMCGRKLRRNNTDEY